MLVTMMPGGKKRVLECHSSLCLPEKELLEWCSGKFHHKNTPVNCEGTRKSEIIINFYQTTECNIQEHSHLRTHRSENLKPHKCQQVEIIQPLKLNIQIYREFRKQVVPSGTKIPTNIFKTFSYFREQATEVGFAIPYLTMKSSRSFTEGNSVRNCSLVASKKLCCAMYVKSHPLWSSG
jgi:hypothetical protein